jgi:hypothetical protein
MGIKNISKPNANKKWFFSMARSWFAGVKTKEKARVYYSTHCET